MKTAKSLSVLLVTASARQDGSVSRRFADEIVQQLQQRYEQIELTTRDVAQGIPYVDSDWIGANFTAAEQRTAEHQATLSYSDTLVDEVQQADLILLATPIYNFSVPASLKAWIDMVARVGRTFRYTSDGPVGLLQDKKAYAVIASGGTQIGSEIDFASGYLKHVLGFIGIDDVSIISAERFESEGEQRLDVIREQIGALIRQGVRQAA